MSVSPISDTRISSLAEETIRPGEFDRWFPKAVYLADFWDGLHFILAGGPEALTLPLAALKVGDVTFHTGLEAAHAIWSSTAQAFGAEIQGLSEGILRQRCDFKAMLEANVYPVRTWIYSEHGEIIFQEMMFYFEKLRSVTIKAAKKREGLLFYRYEDF